MPTIADVARRTNVSVATVSRVINGTKYVSPELRARVLKAMEELNYRPNLIASSLRKQETCTVGLIVPDNANPFFSELAKGVEDFGFEHGYSVILCNSDYNLDRERSYVELLMAKQVDGLIFIPSGPNTEHVRELLSEMGRRVVTVDRYTPELETDSIVVDNYAGGRLAAQHLLSLGHERIGCILRPGYLAHINDRIRGFCETLHQEGLDISESLCVYGGFSFAEGVRSARELLSRKSRPTAIFAYNDIMAVGVLRAAREIGLRVPDELAVVGFDNISLASFVTPQLTTIDQPKYRIGELAMETVISRLRGDPPDEPIRRVLDVQLIVRESSDPKAIPRDKALLMQNC